MEQQNNNLSRREFIKLFALSSGAIGTLNGNLQQISSQYPLLPLNFQPRTAISRLEQLVKSSRIVAHEPLIDLGKTYTASPGEMNGNKLIIVSAQESGDTANAEKLSEFLKDYLNLNVTIKQVEDYKPVIDSYVNDGILVLGEDSTFIPPYEFLQDMGATDKPILWINNHAWGLPESVLDELNLDITYNSQEGFKLLDFRGFRPLEDQEPYLVSTSDDNILYEIINLQDDTRIPGAVNSKNLTYISYEPSFDSEAEEFLPFFMALQTAFGVEKPKERETFPVYEQRLRDIKDDDFATGLILPLYSRDSLNGRIGYDSNVIHENLTQIKEAGAEWVDILAMHYQNYNHSSEVFADPLMTPNKESLVNVIEDAHDLGLYVLLKMNLNGKYLLSGQWSGTLLPRNPEKWWDTYKEATLGLAEIARDHEVESLEIGLELSSMEGVPGEGPNPKENIEHWKDLIARVRDTGYKGLVSYQANYHNFEKIPTEWIKDLDYFGIAAYFELTEHPSPSLYSVLQGWQTPIKKIERWVHENPDIPFQFLEIGYASQPYATVYPWSWQPGNNARLDLDEQRIAFTALKQVLEETPEIKGVHYFATTPWDSPTDRGYSIFGKPAEQIMLDTFKIRSSDENSANGGN